jgi:tripeptidyl-peptidase-1
MPRLHFALATALAAAAASEPRVAMEPDRATTRTTALLAANGRSSGGGGGGGWVRGARAAGGTTLPLVFALRQSPTGVVALSRAARAVSDPSDASQYGQHLSNARVQSLLAPTATAAAAVARFLASHGVGGGDGGGCVPSSNGDFLDCAAGITVAQAERMLGTHFHEWSVQPQQADQTPPRPPVLRCDGYSLPASVAAHIDFIAPTLSFPLLPRPRPPPPPLPDARHSQLPAVANTPATLRALYDVPRGLAATSNASVVGATGFLDEFLHLTDVRAFWAAYAPALSGGAPVRIVGPDGGASGAAGSEASLDAEFLSTMANGARTEFWSVAGTAPGTLRHEPFVAWMMAVANTSDAAVPKVFSVSYGECEASVGAAYARRLDLELQKAAARGISVLVATGDTGVGADGGVLAKCPGGKFCSQFPAASAWVTAVGGAQRGRAASSAAAAAVGGSSSFTPPATGEEGWAGSSGGFSNLWARAPWQQTAVSGYLAAERARGGLPAAYHYNASGRGFPDVSAQAVGFTIVNAGAHVTGVTGTSCSAPTFAGLVGLLNDARLRAGKPTLGCLNPLLYGAAAQAGAFFDLVTGSNPGCATSGFRAAPGWDPVVSALLLLHALRAHAFVPPLALLTDTLASPPLGLCGADWARDAQLHSARRRRGAAPVTDETTNYKHYKRLHRFEN